METVAALICLAGPAVVVYIIVQHRSRQQIAALAADLAAAQNSACDAQCALWLTIAPTLTYRNEIEVEAKLVWPLVTFAGYAPHQIDLRVPVAVQVGRTMANGQADWVLWDSSRAAAVLVVEAKGPGQSLNGPVQAQARSYAYALNAPRYLLTNGLVIAVYRRGVQGDQLEIEAPVAQLAAHWPALVAALNPTDNIN